MDVITAGNKDQERLRGPEVPEVTENHISADRGGGGRDVYILLLLSQGLFRVPQGHCG
jgi:hypothetical protein